MNISKQDATDRATGYRAEAMKATDSADIGRAIACAQRYDQIADSLKDGEVFTGSIWEKKMSATIEVSFHNVKSIAISKPKFHGGHIAPAFFASRIEITDDNGTQEIRLYSKKAAPLEMPANDNALAAYERAMQTLSYAIGRIEALTNRGDNDLTINRIVDEITTGAKEARELLRGLSL